MILKWLLGQLGFYLVATIALPLIFHDNALIPVGLLGVTGTCYMIYCYFSGSDEALLKSGDK